MPRLFTTLAALSLLGLIAAACGWVRSAQAWDEIHWRGSGADWRAGSSDGGAYIEWSCGWGNDHEPLTWHTAPPTRMTLSESLFWRGWCALGFAAVSDRFAGQPGSPPTSHLVLRVPYWAMTLLTILVLLTWVRRLHGVRRRLHTSNGSCPHCSYSLVGNTSGRCPECGRPCDLLVASGR